MVQKEYAFLHLAWSEEDEAEWGPGPDRKQKQEAQRSLSSQGGGWCEEERGQLTNMPSLLSLLG